MELAGTTALVTGGAVRIGRAICLTLAAQGVNVVIHYRRSRREALALAAELSASGVGVHALKADLAGERACERLVRDAARAMGGLRILVNNAAVFHRDSLRSLTERSLTEELRVNLFAPLFLMRAFARRCASGKIVNLADRRIAGHDTTCVPYLFSKQALAEATRLAALEFAPGITVNAVAPGAILAPRRKGLRPMREKAGPNLLNKSCTPQDVADAVVSLLRQDAITGQILHVDGGQHLLIPGPLPL